MRTYAREEATGKVSQRYQQWLTVIKNSSATSCKNSNATALSPARVFENKTEKGAGWYSSGWTSGRDVSQMLDYLWTTGKIMVAGRSGIQKLWDLSERCLPEWTPREKLSEKEVVRRAVQKSLRALGVGTPQHINQHFTRKRYPHLKETLHALQAEGLIEKVRVEDDKGEWFIHTADMPLLDRIEADDFAFERTTLLSPFDNLICDRARTAKLFDFDFRSRSTRRSTSASLATTCCPSCTAISSSAASIRKWIASTGGYTSTPSTPKRTRRSIARPPARSVPQLKTSPLSSARLRFITPILCRLAGSAMYVNLPEVIFFFFFFFS